MSRVVSRSYRALARHARHRQQRGQSRAVVADAWSQQPPALAANGNRDGAREDGVQMRGEGHDAPFALRRGPGNFRPHVAFGIHVDIVKFQARKLAAKIVGARLFLETGRGDGAKFDLPVGDPVLVAGQARQGFSHRWQFGELRQRDHGHSSVQQRRD